MVRYWCLHVCIVESMVHVIPPHVLPHSRRLVVELSYPLLQINCGRRTRRCHRVNGQHPSRSMLLRLREERPTDLMQKGRLNVRAHSCSRTIERLTSGCTEREEREREGFFMFFPSSGTVRRQGERWKILVLMCLHCDHMFWPACSPHADLNYGHAINAFLCTAWHLLLGAAMRLTSSHVSKISLLLSLEKSFQHVSLFSRCLLVLIL